MRGLQNKIETIRAVQIHFALKKLFPTFLYLANISGYAIGQQILPNKFLRENKTAVQHEGLKPQLDHDSRGDAEKAILRNTFVRRLLSASPRLRVSPVSIIRPTPSRATLSTPAAPADRKSVV